MKAADIVWAWPQTPPRRSAIRGGTAPSYLPPLLGRAYGDSDLRYRLWTHAYGLDFDSVPDRKSGGPTTVSTNWWTFAFAPVPDGRVRLWATRNPHGVLERHALHGQIYLSARDAERAAYEAGLTAFLVYERDTDGRGLPVFHRPGRDSAQVVADTWNANLITRLGEDFPGFVFTPYREHAAETG